MAEAGLVYYGDMIGVMIAMAVVCFSLRAKRPHGPTAEAGS
ncbi:MAG: hypothetical protein ACT4N1_01865 [Nitrososphaerota archaeon]